MSNFEDLIKRKREQSNIKQFKGTFLQYLELVKNDPSIPMLAHERLYNVIISKGIEKVKTADDPRLRRIYGDTEIRKYNFFKDFYGVDDVMRKIERYFDAAAHAGEESRQVLYMVGPVGSGKSSIAEALKKALESAPPIYALEGCPIHEEPLHLIPKDMREEFEGELGVLIEGDLCPTCAYRLEHDYHGEFEKFPVNTVPFSIRERLGIGVVPPVDPNNQDTSVLIGSVDISKLDKYSEDDPRVMSFNGAFNVGNRGLVEFIEVFKNEIEYLHAMITATQEKSIPSPGKGSMLYFDGVILAHSNEAEWNKFKSQHTNEAILDRIVKIEIPYCLVLDDEIKIYQKILRRSKFKAHIAPNTLEVASMFAIMSRLAPSNKVDALTKLKIYNGQEIVEKGNVKRVDITELRDEVKDRREGMTGISTRFIIKAIDKTLAESECNCINPISIMETLIKDIEEQSIAPDEKKRLRGFIQTDIKKELNKIIEAEITKAFIYGYGEQAESLLNNYIDNIEAYVNRLKIKDRSTGIESEPDEKFMRSIEEQIGITESAAKGFRSDVCAYIAHLLRNNQKITIDCYQPLKEAIQKKLMTSVKELSRIVTKATVRDKDQREKYDAMVQQMKANGYCDHCCNVILKYAANNLWRD